MRLYLTAKTAMKDLVIDYIEVNLKNGKTISLTWDESEFGIEDGLFTARYKGVYFDAVYGNGLINELRDMQIAEIGVYSENNEPVSVNSQNTNYLSPRGMYSLSHPTFLYEGLMILPALISSSMR